MHLSTARNDIQCLRAFSVIAVILFHLWPNYFPNGYLGVDIFFVISGYLMTSIWSKMEYNSASISNFYIRRIKRIFPLCIFVIFITLVVGKRVLISSDYKRLTKEAKWAVCFGTNLRTIFHRENYFDLIDDHQFLLHTWSLGVEIQYYLLVPFIFNIINYFNKPSIVIILLGTVSLSFQLYCIFWEYETVSFNFIFSRMWQFIFGSAAFYCAPVTSYIALESEDVQSKFIYTSKNMFLKISSTVVLNLIIFFPFLIVISPLFKIFLSLTVTSLSLFFISIHQNGDLFPSFNYFNSLFVYIGNASYSLYLIHWPIIVFAKYMNLVKSNTTLAVILLSIFIVAFIIHEFVENSLRNSSNCTNFIILFVLYSLIPMFCVTHGTVSFTSYNNKTIEEKIALNIKMSNINFTSELQLYAVLDRAFSLIEEDVFHESFNLIKNASVRKEAVLLGNSYAAAQCLGVSKALKELGFTKLYLIWSPTCLPHGGELNLEYPKCKSWNGDLFDKFLINVKPNLLIISTRLNHIPSLLKPLRTSDLRETDFATQQLEKNILKFSKFTKKLIFISPNPDVNLNHPSVIIDKQILDHLKTMINFTYTSSANVARNLQLGLPLKEFILPLNYMFEISHAPEVRLLTAMKKCSNCYFFNTTEIFCDKNGCQLYDIQSELSLFGDGSHLSSIGNEKFVQPLINFLIN